MKNASNYKDCILLHLRSRASSEPNFSSLLKVDLAKMSFAKVKNIWYKPTYYLLTYGFNEKGDLILDGMHCYKEYSPLQCLGTKQHRFWSLAAL